MCELFPMPKSDSAAKVVAPFASRELLERLRGYSETTGVAEENCINEALADWLECVAEPTLDAFRSRPATRTRRAVKVTRANLRLI